jgi:hypothetical protein
MLAAASSDRICGSSTGAARVAREMENAEFQARLAKRQSVDLGRPAARSLDDVRAEREAELGA